MRYNGEYEYDYSRMLEDADDLYQNDDHDDLSEENEISGEWENYYHNITDELVDD